MIEFLIVGIVVLFIFFYTNKANGKKFLSENSKIFMLIKEKDYDFLLISKYGDRVYDPNEPFMKRVRDGVAISAVLIFAFISKLTLINVVVALVIGYLVFKSPYLSLKKNYKSHLGEIDSLLPYYLKGLEILIHHYTVPVALARSVDDAPSIFKPGLKKLISKIESGDSTVDPYMDFAKEYPVRDSMRMMRLLYRLGLGEQEKKHEQLLTFSKSVSNLQAKAREDRYKKRLGKMESQTLLMLVCTGGCTLLLLLISIFMTMNI